MGLFVPHLFGYSLVGICTAFPTSVLFDARATSATSPRWWSLVHRVYRGHRIKELTLEMFHYFQIFDAVTLGENDEKLFCAIWIHLVQQTAQCKLRKHGRFGQIPGCLDKHVEDNTLTAVFHVLPELFSELFSELKSEQRCRSGSTRTWAISLKMASGVSVSSHSSTEWGFIVFLFFIPTQDISSQDIF